MLQVTMWMCRLVCFLVVFFSHTSLKLLHSIFSSKIITSGELIGIEYLYKQTGKVLEDYMKAIETLETTPEDDIIDTGEDDEVLQDTNQIDDLTVSTDGLKDFVLEAPVVLPKATRG